MEIQRLWSDRAVACTTPCVFGLFSIVTLLAKQLDQRTLTAVSDRQLVLQASSDFRGFPRDRAAAELARDRFTVLAEQCRQGLSELTG
jgi:hypothetical protein